MDGDEGPKCLRCGAQMLSAGVHELHEGPVYIGPAASPMPPSILRLELVFCSACGHAELFVPEVLESLAQTQSPRAVLAAEADVATDEGSMEQTWLCGCGEVNFVTYDKCLGCGRPRP